MEEDLGVKMFLRQVNILDGVPRLGLVKVGRGGGEVLRGEESEA